jgi:molybdopterin-guanine dinucleotide biosynthesis protein B
MPVPNITSLQLLGITGYSGSGKTTLLEKILPLLRQRGLRVNVIKRSHHNVQIEPEGKDSARLRQAGAVEVMLATPFRYMLVHEIRNDDTLPKLAELVGRMAPSDWALVEGARADCLPKLEVFRPSTGAPPLYLEDEHIVAVASDVARPATLRRPLAWLDVNRPQTIVDWMTATPALRTTAFSGCAICLK